MMRERHHEIPGLETIIFTGSRVTCECYKTSIKAVQVKPGYQPPARRHDPKQEDIQAAGTFSSS